MAQDSLQEALLTGNLEPVDFAMLGSVITDLDHLDPADRQKRSEFLLDNANMPQRKLLKKQLQVLLDACENAASVEDIAKSVDAECERLSALLDNNTWKALKDCRNLERSYMTLSSFFENAGSVEANNLVLMNAAIEQVADLDNTRFIDTARMLLQDCFDRLELSDSYSMIVIPGYVYSNDYGGSDKPIEKWGKIARENKAMLITDFRDLDIAADVADLSRDMGHCGKEDFRSNIIMACNYLLARRSHEDWGEDDDLYVPGSAALAGRMYSMSIAQLASAKSIGYLEKTTAVHFDTRLSERLTLEGLGLVTMINKSGKVFPFSGPTLYNGNSTGLKKFAVVRLFHHISKVLINIINRMAFEAWTSATQQRLITVITRFLYTKQGHDMLIRDFRLIRCARETDNNTDPVLYLEISFELADSKDFRLSLQSSMGSGAYEWSSEYSG